MNNQLYSKWRNDVEDVLMTHFNANVNLLTDWSERFAFLVDRLIAVPSYGLKSGREMIKMICRCAFNDPLTNKFNDSSLTDSEAIVIMETCLDPALDNILLEVNFNEGW